MVKMFPKYPTLVQVCCCAFFTASKSVQLLDLRPRLTTSVFCRVVCSSMSSSALPALTTQLDDNNVPPLLAHIWVFTLQHWFIRPSGLDRCPSSTSMGKSCRQDSTLARSDIRRFPLPHLHDYCISCGGYQHCWGSYTNGIV